MDPARFPLSDDRRKRLRDDRLWTREVQRARFFNQRSIHCPCIKCNGQRRWLVATVREHLIQNGRHPEFRVWRGPGDRDTSDEEWEADYWAPKVHQTENMDPQIDTRQMVKDAFQEAEEAASLEDKVQDVLLGAFNVADEVHADCVGDSNSDDDVEDTGPGEPVGDRDHVDEGDSHSFDPQALEEAIRPLYEGARSSQLAATILLMNLCTIHGVTNGFADEMFTILSAHLLPRGNVLPKNYYAAKSLTRKLGLSYNSIHACDKGCMLFRGQHAEAIRCPKCGGPRFHDETRRKIPVKVLRHFPLIPRLQRMFRSPSISKLMLWHSENSGNREGRDNLVRHPCDLKAWRHFHENVDASFGDDPRNVHFALAVDGVNPFKQTRSTWSTWPVTLLNYNLPPWLCTKKFFIILTLLIPGKQSVTSEHLDVYLEPLAKELLQLWGGVSAYDVLKDVGNREFTLRGMLLWTIHDYPGYGAVGGFSHQGYAGCPYCGSDLGVEHSLELGKQTYGGTRRWLDPNHAYRSAEMKDHFNGKMENQSKPHIVSVEEQL